MELFTKDNRNNHNSNKAISYTDKEAEVKTQAHLTKEIFEINIICSEINHLNNLLCKITVVTLLMLTL
jgi:hypothetical protein